ncbi:MAG: hypothetical protein P1P90_06345 [Patescibacteria group bacterium]|nr:hypothetical protein [Patescibacteria group bacterium]
MSKGINNSSLLAVKDNGVRVPDGTILLLVRHFETWWNYKKCSAIYGKQPMPARTDDDCDSSLSSIGRIQAVLTGWWLSKSFQEITGKQPWIMCFLAGQGAPANHGFA